MKAATLLLTILLLASPLATAQNLLDLSGPPTGYWDNSGTPSITTGVPIEWSIRFEVGTAGVNGSTNGFRVYSPDGATFAPITWDTLVDMSRWYVGGFFFNPFGVDGLGADTIGFGGFNLLDPLIPVGSSFDAYLVATQVDTTQNGKHLCIDSSWYPPSGLWLWSTVDGYVYPYWGGPYCYEIQTCCTGSTGDVDLDYDVTVADLTLLIDYMFGSHPSLPCNGAGDVDGLSAGGTAVNVGDLSYLKAFLFSGGPAPVPCPN